MKPHAGGHWPAGNGRGAYVLHNLPRFVHRTIGPTRVRAVAVVKRESVLRRARREGALQLWVQLAGEFTPREQCMFGVSADGSIGPNGLTEAGLVCAEKLIAAMERVAAKGDEKAGGSVGKFEEHGGKGDGNSGAGSGPGDFETAGRAAGDDEGSEDPANPPAVPPSGAK